MNIEDKLYHYRATVLSAWDGDTCRISISAGLGLWLVNEPVRLFGINAPEKKRPTLVEGKAARDYLRELIVGKEVIVETLKDKKGRYRRYIVKIYLPDDESGKTVNDMMVEAGHAVYKEY